MFHSTWSQAVAATIGRSHDIEIYHTSNHLGALAPIYLLPTFVSVCLFVLNAEFRDL